jgi:hypothetical protein
MPDYAAQANAEYDPQLAAEQTTLNADRAASATAFGTETNSANNAYNDALKAGAQTRDAGYAHDDAVAVAHGLYSSGLAANAQHLTYQHYADNASHTAELRAQKLSDIATRRTNADQGYTAKSGALTSKYQGLKAGYVNQHNNDDAKQAAAEARANARAARSSAGRAPSLGQTKQNTIESLRGDVQAGFGNYHAHSAPQYGQAERIIKTLTDAYPELSPADIQKEVYGYRSAKFNE